MSFLLRSTSRATSYTIHITKRHAHKKANIQVKLNEFVEGVGIQDEIVAVRPGLMRNILYPTRKASYIDKSTLNAEGSSLANSTEQERILNQEKLKNLAEQSIKKNRQLLGHLEQVRELKFNRAVVPNSDHTFGSVTADDLVSKLKEDYGLDVDKSTIEFKSEGGRIKSLGQHKVFVQIGQTTAEINVLVGPVLSSA